MARTIGTSAARRLQPGAPESIARWRPFAARNHRDGQAQGGAVVIRRPDGAAPPIAYEDFVISATRKNARSIGVTVKASPAGAMRTVATIPFSSAEADRIRTAFCVSTASGHGTSGGMLIKQDEATTLGKRLAKVLLPPAVFRLLAESMASVGHRPGRGLRLRLDLDPTSSTCPGNIYTGPIVRTPRAPPAFC